MPTRLTSAGPQRWSVLYSFDVHRKSKRWKDGILQSSAVPGNEARVRLQLLDETVPTDESPDSSSSACASRAHQRRRTVFSETVPRTKIDVSGEVFSLGNQLLVQVLEPVESVEEDCKLAPPALRDSLSPRAAPSDGESLQTGLQGTVRPANSTRRPLGVTGLRRLGRLPNSINGARSTGESHAEPYERVPPGPARRQSCFDNAQSLSSTGLDLDQRERSVQASKTAAQFSRPKSSTNHKAGASVSAVKGGSAHEDSAPMQGQQNMIENGKRCPRVQLSDEQLLSMLAEDSPLDASGTAGAPQGSCFTRPQVSGCGIGPSAFAKDADASTEPHRFRVSASHPRLATCLPSSGAIGSVGVSVRHRSSASRQITNAQDLTLTFPRRSASSRKETADVGELCPGGRKPAGSSSSTQVSLQTTNTWNSIPAYRQEMLLLLAAQIQKQLDAQAEVLERACEQILDHSSKQPAYAHIALPHRQGSALIVRHGVESFAVMSRTAKNAQRTRHGLHDETKQPPDDQLVPGTKYFLRFRPESRLDEFATCLDRDALWALGTRTAWREHFRSEHSSAVADGVTLVRSLYHGVSTVSGLLEVQPLGRCNRRIWRKQPCSVLVMCCACLPTELLCLDAFLNEEPFGRLHVLRQLVGSPVATTNTKQPQAQNDCLQQVPLRNEDQKSLESCNGQPFANADIPLVPSSAEPGTRSDSKPSSDPAVQLEGRQRTLFSLDSPCPSSGGVPTELASACAAQHQRLETVSSAWNLEQQQQQQQVIQACLNGVALIRSKDSQARGVDRPHLVAVHGAFGTGKTRTLVESILAMLEQQPSLRILVAAGTNVAVDNILLGLLQRGFKDFARAGNEGRMHPSVCEFTLKGFKKRFRRATVDNGRDSMQVHPASAGTNIAQAMSHEAPTVAPVDGEFPSPRDSTQVEQSMSALRKRVSGSGCRTGLMKRVSAPQICFTGNATSTKLCPQRRRDSCLDLRAPAEELDSETVEKASREAFRSRSVVGVTCASATQAILHGLRFDVVLVDEASQIMEPLALAPILELGADHVFVVIAGDERQLPPLMSGRSSEDVPDQCCISRSLLKRLGERADILNLYLTVQFRCHPQIAQIASELAYGGAVRSAYPITAFPAAVPRLAPVTFVPIDGHDEASLDKSRFNRVEAQWIVRFLQRIARCSAMEPTQVGVICLYRAQAAIIQHLANASDNAELGHRPRISAAKIESSRWSMASVKISTIDAFQGGERKLIVLSTVCSCRSQGRQLLDSLERVNVALTRASHHLIITGHRLTLTSNPIWRRVLEHCEPLPPSLAGTAPNTLDH